MARGRMIDKVISISTRFKKLDWTGKALYLMLMPHTDDFGRMEGDPEVVKALVCPMEKITIDSVGKRLQQMHDVGLICWYERDDTLYLAVWKFDSHQTGLHKRTRSNFPQPPPEAGPGFSESPADTPLLREIPGTSAATEGKGREGKRTEKKRKEPEILKKNLEKMYPKLFKASS